MQHTPEWRCFESWLLRCNELFDAPGQRAATKNSNKCRVPARAAPGGVSEGAQGSASTIMSDNCVWQGHFMPFGSIDSNLKPIRNPLFGSWCSTFDTMLPWCYAVAASSLRRAICLSIIGIKFVASWCWHLFSMPISPAAPFMQMRGTGSGVCNRFRASGFSALLDRDFLCREQKNALMSKRVLSWSTLCRFTKAYYEWYGQIILNLNFLLFIIFFFE